MPELQLDLDAARWQALLERCPNATFFHTPAWYAAHARLGYRARTAALSWPDGTEALLPFATSPGYRGIISQAHAGIETGYGGLVATAPLDRGRVDEAYALLRKRFPDLTVAGNPHQTWDALPMAPRDRTQTLVLPVLAREEQLKRMSDTRRKHVKRAAKGGFTLEVVSPVSAADVASFYPLYAERAAQWEYKRWVRDEAYFQALAEAAGEHLALVLAHKDGQLAGFRVVAWHGGLVSDLFLATHPDHEGAHVGTLLVVETLAWLHERGMHTFDFLPSGRLEGVSGFKSSFGATPLDHAVTRQSGLLGQALGKLAGLRRKAS